MFAQNFEKTAKFPETFLKKYGPSVALGALIGASASEDNRLKGATAGGLSALVGTAASRKGKQVFDYLRHRANWVPKYKATEWIADMSPELAGGLRSGIETAGYGVGLVAPSILNRYVNSQKEQALKDAQLKIQMLEGDQGVYY